MRRTQVLIFVAVLLAIMSCLVYFDSTAYSQNGDVVDVIFLVDTTESMVGVCNKPAVCKNIWSDVQNYVLKLVDALYEGTRVVVLPYDRGVRWDRTYPSTSVPGMVDPVVLTDEEKARIRYHLQQLPVDGQATYIYESLESALSLLKKWQQADPGRVHRQMIYLYTDGLDNGPHRALGIDGIISLYKGAKADIPYLYMVYGDIGKNLTEPQRKRAEEEGIGVTTGIPERHVVLRTREIDFGDLSVDASGVSRVLEFASEDPTVWNMPVNLSIDRWPHLSILPNPIALQPQVSITLTAPFQGIPPGGYHAMLVLRTMVTDTVIDPSVVAVHFSWPSPIPTTVIPTQPPTSIPTPIPTVIPEPTVTPTPFVSLQGLRLGQQIDFGLVRDLRRGKRASFLVRSTSDKVETLEIQEVRFAQSQELRMDLTPTEIAPAKDVRVTFTLSSTAPLPPGNYEGEILLRSSVVLTPSRILFTFRVPTAWERARGLVIPVGLAFAVLLVVAFGGVYRYWHTLPQVQGVLVCKKAPVNMPKHNFALRRFGRLHRRNVVTIGRTRPADIRLPHSSVQPLHAQIVAERHYQNTMKRDRVVRRASIRYYVDNLGDGTCQVRGRPLVKGARAILTHESTLTIGEYEFIYQNRLAKE